MGSKELSEKFEHLSRRSAVTADEKQLLDVCSRINVKPRVVRDWLESISVIRFVESKANKSCFAEIFHFSISKVKYHFVR
jgi:hypothetical protein